MKTADEYLLEQMKGFENHEDYKPENIKAIASFMDSYAKYYHSERLSDLLQSDDEIDNDDLTMEAERFDAGANLALNKIIPQ